MRQTLKGNAIRQGTWENPSGGNAAVQKECATTAGVPLCPENWRWIISFPYPAAARVQKGIRFPAARNATPIRNIFFQWNGSSIWKVFSDLWASSNLDNFNLEKRLNRRRRNIGTGTGSGWWAHKIRQNQSCLCKIHNHGTAFEFATIFPLKGQDEISFF